MKLLTHTTAKSSHYNGEAQYYDDFNEKNSEITNAVLEKILKKYEVSTVLDLTCGTGSQVFWLLDAGFDVVGADINASMLRVAWQKAMQKKVTVQFLKGDCRYIHVGQFDAILTIFNAIGHLTRDGF